MKEDDNPKNKMEGIISQDGAKDDKIKVDSEKLKAEVDKTGVEASKHEMEVASADDGGETGGGRRARDTSARQGGKTECSICGLKLAQVTIEQKTDDKLWKNISTFAIILVLFATFCYSFATTSCWSIWINYRKTEN